jgi:hypothetical protein
VTIPGLTEAECRHALETMIMRNPEASGNARCLDAATLRPGRAPRELTRKLFHNGGAAALR